MSHFETRRRELVLEQRETQERIAVGDLGFIAGRLEELGLVNYAAGIREAIERLKGKRP